MTGIRQEVPLISGPNSGYIIGMIHAIIKTTFYRVKTVTKTKRLEESGSKYEIEVHGDFDV